MIVALVAAAVIGIAVALALVGPRLLERLGARRGHRGNRGPDPDDDGGRGGNGGPGGDDGPPWWPDFERQLREYVATERR